MITIFTAPKPFHGHVATIQHNALASWTALGSGVQVLLIGDEVGVAEAAAEAGVRHLPSVARNELGTPLLSSIFTLAHQAASHDVLCYVNADILLLEDLLPAVQIVRDRFSRFLLLARRWDLDVPGRLQLDEAWRSALRSRIATEGSLHPPTGSDIFVFPRSMFQHLPDFALGRSGWDNWMIFAARRAHIPVIDATESVTVVHQRHDYSHLPGGEPHYHLPESRRNVDLAGGRAAVFTILDASWRLQAGGLEKKPWRSYGCARAVEAEIYAILGLPMLIRWARLALHPFETIRYYSTAVGRRLRRLAGAASSFLARR